MYIIERRKDEINYTSMNPKSLEIKDKFRKVEWR